MTKSVINPKCRACSLPPDERRALDKALVRGEAITKLAQKFNLSRDVLYRHRNAHLQPILVAGGDKSLRNHAASMLDTMLQRMQELTVRTEDLLNQAEDKSQIRNALLAIQQLRNNYEVMGKIVTSMQEAGGGLDPGELEEYYHWKENVKDKWKDTMNELSEEDRQVIHDICVYRIIQMDSQEQAEDYIDNSWYMKRYGPDRSELDAMFARKERKMTRNRAFTSKVEEYHSEDGDRPDLTGSTEPNPRKKELVRTRTKPKDQ